MEATDPLSQYLALLRIRRRATRRNGLFVLALMLGAGALGAVYLGQQYQIDWDALQFPFVFMIMMVSLIVQAANDSMLKSMIELIEAMQRPHRYP